MVAIDFLTKVANTRNDVSTINKEMNRGWGDAVEKMQDIIAINYAGECNIKSPFWDVMKDRAQQRLRNSDRFQFFVKTSEEKPQGYFIHPEKVMSEYINGYKINLKELKRS